MQRLFVGSSLNSAVLGLLVASLISGCGTRCVTATFNRIEPIDHSAEIKTTAYEFGGLLLQSEAGLWVELRRCGEIEGIQNLCMYVYLPKGHRFQFLDTNFTALGFKGRPTTQLKFDSVEYTTNCVVPDRITGPRVLYEGWVERKTCPAEETGPPPVTGPIQSKEIQYAPGTRSTVIVDLHTFDPSLEFQGADSGGRVFSVHKEMYWRQYKVTVLRNLTLDSDFTLVPPRIAFDGNEVRLPKLSIRTVTDKACYFQELM